MNKKEKKRKLLQTLSDHVNKKYLGFLNYNDRLITRNLREDGLITRDASSNGLWCCAILPAVLMFYNLTCSVSPVYSIVTCTSLGLLFYCMLVIAFLTVSSLVLREQVCGGCIASSLVSALLLYAFVLKDLTKSMMISLPALFAFSNILRVSIVWFPKTFTIGEAMIVAQSIVLYSVMIVARVFDDTVDDELDLITAVANTVLSTVGIIVTALILIPDTQRNLKNLANIVLGAGLFGVVLVHCLVGIDCFAKVLGYVFGTSKRIQLFTFWLVIVLIAVAMLLVRTNLAVKASTVTRKSFHILASTVFLSGILCDQRLMMLAAVVGLGLLVLVECLRKSGIEPISSALQSAFLVYSDEKDSGAFAMTPLYLYCGLACPLLLVPHHSGSQVELLAGVLSIGVGDTAASWFGSRYGFNKWTGSTSKSLEGTAFNILSQLSTIYALELFSLMDARNALIRTAVASTLSSLVEALTVQVDNLVLPIVTLIAFQITWPLR